MKYENMLDRAYKKLPEKSLKQERFEIPKLDVLIQGSKTIVANYSKAMDELHRDKKHAMKYFSSQVASAVNIDGNRLMIKGVFSRSELQGILEDYIKKYILCKECSRPDTKMTEHKGIKMLKCDACGALSAIRE